MPTNQLPPPADPWLWPSSPVPLQRPSIAIAVYRYQEDATSRDDALTPMTSLRVITVTQKMGTDPGSAVLRYAFDGIDPDSPQSITDALSTVTTIPKAIRIGDRIVIIATRPDGIEEFIFDGFPVKFALAISGDREGVQIVCKGVARKAWESPISSSEWRDADKPDDPTANTVTSLPVQFNPRGQPNACPDDAWIDNESGRGETYPAFIDHRVIRSPDIREYWTVAGAAAMLIFRHNADATYLSNPDPTSLKNLLVAKEPIDGTTFDVADPSTYTAKDLIAKDDPRTGRDWPTQLDTIIRDYGFGMNWVLVTDARSSFNKPKTILRIFAQQAGDRKSVWLQPRGSQLDPAVCNIGEARIERDIDQVANQWHVHGRLKRIEASLVLAPGFAQDIADAASMSTLAAFDANGPKGDTNAYRNWVFDETGEGTYRNLGKVKSTVATPFGDIFGVDDMGEPYPVLVRRRPALPELITVDDDGKPKKYEIAVSTDYAGDYPAVWDGSGTWQTVTKGGYELLKDRLGIRVTAQTPNDWKIGESTVAAAPYPRGNVRIIEAMTGAQPTIHKPFFIRLTCVVSADDIAYGHADRRDTSPVPEAITRIVDAKDRFEWNVIAPHSTYNPLSTSIEITDRDDSDKADAEAEGYRLSAELGVLQGEITIPRFTNYYAIGDRIQDINGRGLGLRTDSIGEANASTYPIVESITWSFEQGQSTAITLSDEAQARHKVERKLRRKEMR
jgi:hypothetical protein